MEENLWILAAAVSSGYLCVTDVVAWADQQILQIDSPPGWLLDLCLVKNQDEAVGTLLMEWNRYMEMVAHEWPEPEIHGDLLMGFLYLRFERGDLTMAELLRLAGEYADAPGYRIDCETFYYMLNEIDGGGPTIPSEESLDARVASLFAPMSALARLHLGKLPKTAIKTH